MAYIYYLKRHGRRRFRALPLIMLMIGLSKI
jgi:hypothetical protein